MSFHIRGIGSALPCHTMSQAEALSLSTDLICRDQRQQRLAKTMFRRARVDNRHTCVPHEIAYRWVDSDLPPGESLGPTTLERMQLYAAHAGPLAVDAAARALGDAGTSPTDISHLITVSCTGFAAPGVDIELMESLGLHRSVQRIHVGFMGCHGAINGLRVASGLAAENDGRMLLSATELCSLHYRFQWDDERVLGNALFADGSAAVVGDSGRPGDSPRCQVKTTGSYIIPDSRDAITWVIGNHGFEMSLSSQVPDLIRAHLKSWLADWLASHDLTVPAVASWAVHPGGPRILDAIEDALDLPPQALETSRDVLRQFGNMSSPTVLFILQRLLAAGTSLPCVALGFGPGLAIEAAIFQ